MLNCTNNVWNKPSGDHCHFLCCVGLMKMRKQTAQLMLRGSYVAQCKAIVLFFFFPFLWQIKGGPLNISEYLYLDCHFSDIVLFSYKQRTLVPHFLANWLARNKKKTEKSVFQSPEMTSQSFPVSCVSYPTGSEISRFWYIKTQGRKIDFYDNCRNSRALIG